MTTKERMETQLNEQIQFHRTQANACKQHAEMIAQQQREAVAILTKLPVMAEGLDQVIPMIDKRLVAHQENQADKGVLEEAASIRALIVSLSTNAKARVEQTKGQISTLESLAGTFTKQATEHESRARGLEIESGRALGLAERQEPPTTEASGEIKATPAPTPTPTPSPSNGPTAAAKRKVAKTKAKKKTARKARPQKR